MISYNMKREVDVDVNLELIRQLESDIRKIRANSAYIKDSDDIIFRHERCINQLRDEIKHASESDVDRCRRKLQERKHEALSDIESCKKQIYDCERLVRDIDEELKAL